MSVKKVNISLHKIRNYIGNMRLLLCAYKIYYYEIISFFSKEGQNESHASTDFAYLCSSSDFD